MSGCLDEFLLNGEQLPLDGATDRFDVQQVGQVSSQCDVVAVPFSSPVPGGVGQPAWQLPVIIVCAVIGFCLVVLLILLVVFRVHRRRTRECLLLKASQVSSSTFSHVHNSSGLNTPRCR